MNLLRRLFPRKLSWQIMLIFILLAMIPFTVLSTMALNRMAEETDREAKERITQILRLTGKNLNAHFHSIKLTTEKMYRYDIYSEQGIRMNLENILKNAQDPRTLVRNYVSGLLESDEFIRNVLFVDTVNSEVYSASTSNYSAVRLNWPFLQWPFLEKAAHRPRQLSISDPHMEAYFLHSSHQVISFCRPFLSLNDLPNQETILGYLIIDVDTTVFDDAFRIYDWRRTGTLYVTSADGLILYSSDAEQTGRLMPESVPDGISILFESIPDCQWRIQYHLDPELLTGDIHRLRDRLLIISAAAMLTAALTTWFSSRKISRPVSSMLQQMDRVQQGDLSAHVPVTGRDELSALGDGFNQMVSKLDAHIRQSYVASIKQKEAELDALRMQIHPHFLYNTLEVIRMSSVAHHDLETAQMTLSLVNQLQYVIGESGEHVPLQKELDIVRDYISLVSLRYGQIECKTAVPASLLSCRILKMTLQPIVENAVQHGLRPLGGGQISISAARQQNLLCLTVMDNGCGMDQEQLEKLRNQISSDKMPEIKEDGLRSIGMKNVHDRIRMACGNAYGLEIESQPGIGTAVVIRLPYLKPESEETHETADRG